MIGIFGGKPDLEHACSRAGCADEATWALRWRNPKIHPADRHKTWLSCDAHLAYLKDFLEARSFPLEVLSLRKFVSTASPMKGTNEH